MKAAMGDDYLLSVALAPYCADLTTEAIAAIDYVELMSYDLWDDERVHAPTSVAIESVQTLLELGLRPEQINMGIPTYGRPMMGEAYWYDYRWYYQQLDKNGMYYDESNGLTISFNTYETVYEKTVWAIENGLGGVMTFAIHCDLTASNPMALHNAVAKARADKLADTE